LGKSFLLSVISGLVVSEKFSVASYQWLYVFTEFCFLAGASESCFTGSAKMYVLNRAVREQLACQLAQMLLGAAATLTKRRPPTTKHHLPACQSDKYPFPIFRQIMKMRSTFWILSTLLLLVGCSEDAANIVVEELQPEAQIAPLMPAYPDEPYLVVLGTAQDAGYPQANCGKQCCDPAWDGMVDPEPVSCLGIIDPISGQTWMFDATPDFKVQLEALSQYEGTNSLSGIFLTHGHMGHYTGLMHLGHEAMGASEVPVYAMPRMDSFLRADGPWSQLVNHKNIKLMPLENAVPTQLNERLFVTPHIVPHRDEYTETVGFTIQTASKKVLFIPDIDKWHLWEIDIKTLVADYDYLFLDGTFYSNGEIPGRDMSEIPHPFVEESMALFKDLTADEKGKIHFIHFNHTNPVLGKDSEQSQEVESQGFNLARQGDVLAL
jgi:pyrroloquinoline quinone biosynthesis protein B